MISGFTNSTVIALVEPPIVPVSQRAFEMGQVATQLLIGLIESRYPVTEFETRMLDTELISPGDSGFNDPHPVMS